VFFLSLFSFFSFFNLTICRTYIPFNCLHLCLSIGLTTDLHSSITINAYQEIDTRVMTSNYLAEPDHVRTLKLHLCSIDSRCWIIAVSGCLLLEWSCLIGWCFDHFTWAYRSFSLLQIWIAFEVWRIEQVWSFNAPFSLTLQTETPTLFQNPINQFGI